MGLEYGVKEERNLEFDQNRKAQEAKEADSVDLETLENIIKKQKK
ncbi:hypothetical protein [Flavobacterium crassostreae]|nr:hypothetical protein [Flavobacterium crassostreae]